MFVATFSFLCRVLCHLLGSFYPAYASYRAVLSRDAEEHKQWLCYWVVNALFVVAELFSDFLSWLPLYWEAKLALIIWLTLYRGATVIYDNLVHKCVAGGGAPRAPVGLPAHLVAVALPRRYLERFEPEIDAKLTALQQSADAAFAGLKARAVRQLQRGSRTILQAGGAALAELAMATATTAALESTQESVREEDGGGDYGDDADAADDAAPPRPRRR